jgi:hypothetical protein
MYGAGGHQQGESPMEAIMDISQWAGAIAILLLAAYGLLHVVFSILDSANEPWGPEAPDHKDRQEGSTRG